MRTNDSLLDLLLELQALDRVPRMGWVLRGVPDSESVAEHSFHVALLVWLLAPRLPDVDAGRAVGMALLHDLAEVRLGDLPRVAGRYFPAGAKSTAETGAEAELLAPLTDGSQELVAEYRAGESPEARLVKACDKLQLMVKACVYQNWGVGALEKFWRNPDNFVDGGFAPVRELFNALRERHDERAGTKSLSDK